MVPVMIQPSDGFETAGYTVWRRDLLGLVVGAPSPTARQRHSASAAT